MVLLTSLYVFFAVGMYQYVVLFKYVINPLNINCSAILQLNRKQILDVAYLESQFLNLESFWKIKLYELQTELNSRIGALKCFCEVEKNNEVPKDYTYSLHDEFGNPINNQLCYEW